MYSRLYKILSDSVNANIMTKGEAELIDILVLFHLGSELPEEYADPFKALTGEQPS